MIELGRAPKTFAMVLGIAALVAACAADAIVGERTSSASARQAAPKLVQCPSNETTSSSAVIGPLGGVVDVGGTSIQIPAGALLSPVTVTVTIPASPYMEIDISVAGVEHFVFEQPVVVTLSYARCTRSDIDASPLSVWYIDSSTKDLLEPMGGVDDKLLRAITFTTGHLSGYAVAN
jgi:hypothetical protein